VAAFLKVGMKMPHQVLARKWRPRRFDEVVGQAYVVQALKNALDQQYLHHAYLFTGTRGVGKTSLARIFAKCLNCEKGISSNPCDECNSCREIDAGRFPDLFEIDAASRTKVEDTRELLENVLYAPSKGRFKVYLIDEVHMLSGHSFNALLKTLEEPPPHVKFLLATTDYQKLPATILSRCLQFHLTLMPPTQVATHLRHVLDQEQIEYEIPATELLGKAANGSMRDALSLLDQSIAYGNGKLLTADVKVMLGMIEPTILLDMLDALSAKDGNALFAGLHNLAEQGVDFSQALADLLSLIHQIAMIQTVPEITVANDSERLRDLAKRLQREDVQLFYQIGLMGQRDLPFAPTAQTGFEMTLLRMLAFYPQTQNSSEPKSHQPQTATSTTNTTISAAPISTTDIRWHELLPQLELTGAALALAQQCSLKSFTDTHLSLSLHPKQKPLLQKKHTDRISEALSKHFNRLLSVNIEIGDQQSDTPAAIAQRQQRDRQTAAEQAMINNQQVQRIMQTFDATLVKTSIIANKEGTSE
jgi:DNA polymerase-3 subunit gamma/tau